MKTGLGITQKLKLLWLLTKVYSLSVNRVFVEGRNMTPQCRDSFTNKFNWTSIELKNKHKYLLSCKCITCDYSFMP